MWQLTMHRSSHKATPVSTSNVLRLASAATEFRRFHLHTTYGANLSCRNRNPSQRLHRVCKNSGLIFGVSGILGPCWRPFVVHSTKLRRTLLFRAGSRNIGRGLRNCRRYLVFTHVSTFLNSWLHHVRSRKSIFDALVAILKIGMTSEHCRGRSRLNEIWNNDPGSDAAHDNKTTNETGSCLFSKPEVFISAVN